MPAGAVGSVWATGSWSDTCWETGTWGTASAEYNLFTDGLYVAVNLGDGVMYLKKINAKVKANLTTGHVGST